jgi:mannosyltransferase
MITEAATPMRTRIDSRTAYLAGMVCIFAIALGVRLYGIDAKPYWMDEITTIDRASLPFMRLVSDSLTFHHFPTYFLLISWLVPFGAGEALLRLPSAVCGALTCAVAANTGHTLGGGRAGLMTGLLLAFSPLQVTFSQEARPSALAVLLITVALHGLVQLARDPKGASLPLRDAGANRRAWATYFVATVAAVYVLGVALFWAGAAWIAMLIIARHRDANRRGLVRNSVLVHGAAAVITIPGYVAMFFFVHGYGRLLEGLDWIPPATLERATADIGSVYLMLIMSPINSRLFAGAVPFMPIVVAALAGLGALYLWRRQPLLIVLTLAIAVLPLTLLAISAVFPLWLARYLLWSAVPFFVVAGLGIAILPRRLQGYGAAAVGTLAFLNLLPYYGIESKPRWDLAADQLLHPAIAQRDLVLVADVWVPRMMNIYLSRKGAALERAQWTFDVNAAASRLAEGKRVWAVFGRVGQADHENLESFLDRIAPLGAPASEARAGRDIVILMFAAPAMKAGVRWRGPAG